MPLEVALKAIAEPRRREILRMVLTEELSSSEIAAHFDVSHPAISQHLRVLSNAGLVSVRRQGTRRLYKSRPEGLEELREYLEAYWDDKLMLLAEAAETEERKKRASDPE